MKVRYDPLLGTTILFQAGEENTCLATVHFIMELMYSAGDDKACQQIEQIYDDLKIKLDGIGHA